MRQSCLIEKLEDRRLLSVSASVIAGPTAVGDTFSYGGVVNGKSIVTSVDTVVGTTTFNGTKALDISITDYANGKVTGTAQRFQSTSLTNGLYYFGKTTDSKEGTTDYTELHTFAPAELVSVPSIVAGKVYTATTKETIVSKTNGKVTGTTTATHVLTGELMSNNTQVITTPAGKFNCYEVTITEKVTTGSTTTTTTEQLWYSSAVGLVKGSANGITIELLSYKL